MKPSDKVEKIFTETNIETNSDVDSVVLDDAIRAMSKSKENAPGCDKSNAWRIIMKNRITKIAVAAVVIIAAMIATNQFGGSIDGSSMAWAKVVEKCYSFKTATYTFTIVGDFYHQEYMYDVIQSKYCLAYGKSKITRIAGNSENGDILVLSESIIDDNNQTIFIDHETKQFFETDRPKPQTSSRDIVGTLKSLPLQADEVIGTKIIDDKEAVGYLLKGYGVDIEIWVDGQTYNPIMVEFIDNNSHELNGVYSNFSFDLSIDESEFDIQIPAEYSKMDIPESSMQTEQPTVDDFIYYLGLYAKYSENGCFPDKITISKDKVGLYGSVGLSPVESAKCTELEIMEMSVKGPKSYQFLNKMKPENDWHYAGKGVSPTQLDTPIFWWKITGSQNYTVIFANLSIGTLTKEELP